MTSTWKTAAGRLRALASGRVEWIDEDGTIEVEWLNWIDRWTIFGIHSHNWAWVRRQGKMDCGCTRNPVTRRMVLYRWGCPTHCAHLDLSS